jgi:hypothetical protein
MIVVDSKPLPGNEIAPNIKVGDHYDLVQTITCSCGQEHYDIGLKSEYNYIRCYACKKDLPKGDSIHWCHPSRFIND